MEGFNVMTPLRSDKRSVSTAFTTNVTNWNGRLISDGANRAIPPRPKTAANTAIEDAWGPPAFYGKNNHNVFGSTPTPSRLISDQQHTLEREEDYVEYYQDKINSAQHRQLYPLLEDIADWMNKTLSLEYLRPCNLLDMLDNGVLLCQLARLIQSKAEESIAAGYAKPPVPTISPRCFKTAARRSFFARDNMEKFIQFCKKLGVHQHLLFESDDLVLQNQPRNVILCLMEVSRLAVKYGIEPPGLVKFEREIALEEESQHDSGLSHDSIASWQLQESPKPQRLCSSTTAISNGNHYPTIMDSASDHQLLTNVNGKDALRRTISEGDHLHSSPPMTTNGMDKNHRCTPTAGVGGDTTEDEWSRGSSDGHSDVELDNKMNTSKDDLDKKVQRATHIVRKQCRCGEGKCERLKVKKVGEGRYTIAGRNVFIRLLKGRHMMVRVGGGWDTLENFLARHDPCQASASRAVSRTNSPTITATPSSKQNANRRCSSTPLYHGHQHHHRSSPIDTFISR